MKAEHRLCLIWDRLHRYAPPVGYAAVIFLMSSRPLPSALNLEPFPGYDKILHALGYAVLALLLLRAFSGAGQGAAGLLPYVLPALLLAAGYALTDEIHQGYAGRFCTLGDYAADVTGAALGLGAVVVLEQRRAAGQRMENG